MLSDEQVDELERVIFGSTIDDLPMILGKALPLLFAELRIVRATLDSKVSRFLEVPNVTNRDAGTGGSEQLVPVRDEPEASADGDAREVPVHEQAEAAGASVGTRKQEAAGGNADTGRGEAADSGSEKPVAPRNCKPKVGRPRKQKGNDLGASVSDDLTDELPSLK